ncbi:cupin-like domain-containing protein [Parapedobacter indicus]|uniref:Cupin-like domain-containing protein n=1 Tax=Parapedobacter indicus TaxID=1477437 RepID=A0A1I3FIW8_9SPHI|nr:cupin-like domain-containing protein [Parapedobacter indicus]PPL03747.1 Cupin-like domain-containing protein [Parapedobacter indicus]SFI11144.1 Cupin-like domain-containing protein [Parapedobacter indicus]
MATFNLEPLERIQPISKAEFIHRYYRPQRPVLIENLTNSWNSKWTFDHIKSLAGDQTVPLYDNKPAQGKESVYAPVTTMQFGEYIDLLKTQPTDLRIFFYTLKDHCPQLLEDFEYPDIGLTFFKRLPALFFGGGLSKVFAHYDIDLPDNLHIHFEGNKRVVLFGPEQSTHLYKVPFSIHNIDKIDMDNPDFERYPALKHAKGYEVYMKHGDALYMPSGWWHYITYLDGGFSMTLRALPRTPKRFLKMIYNVSMMRLIDNTMRKIQGQKWLDYKEQWAYRRTQRLLSVSPES